jgi:hypothetical protein
MFASKSDADIMIVGNALATSSRPDGILPLDD